MMRRKSSFILVYFNVFSIEKSRNRETKKKKRKEEENFCFELNIACFVGSQRRRQKKLINSTPSHKSNKFVIRVNRKKSDFGYFLAATKIR